MTEIPIASIAVKNFKSLKDTGTLDLKPITLLVGANSSGKSALLQTILVLKQTLESRNIETPLILKGKYVNLGSFKDMIFGHDLNDALEISLCIRGRHLREEPSTSKVGFPFVKFKIGFDRDKEQLVNRSFEFLTADKIDISFYDQKIHITSKSIPPIQVNEKFMRERRNFLIQPRHLPELQDLLEYRHMITYYQRQFSKMENERKKLMAQLEEEATGKGVKKTHVTSRLNELEERMRFIERRMADVKKRIKQVFGDTKPEQLEKVSSAVRALRVFSFNIENLLIRDTYYIGPLREFPQRYYLASGEYPRDVGLRGEHTAEIIYYDFRRKEMPYSELRKWLKKMNLAHGIELSPVTEGIYALYIRDPKIQINVNLADIGFGASQLLPILVEGIYARKGSILLVEQPEIHLHPKLQAILADFFIDMANKGKQLLVETHSEHLILRIQRRIAEGKISSDDVAIYYFEPSRDGSKVNRIMLNEHGIIRTWPEGFFEEDLVDSFELLKAVGDRKKSVSSS